MSNLIDLTAEESSSSSSSSTGFDASELPEEAQGAAKDGVKECREWFCTINNPKPAWIEEPKQLFEAIKTRFGEVTAMCGQVERGKEGTQHLQFFFKSKDKKRVQAAKKLVSFKRNKRVDCTSNQCRVSNQVCHKRRHKRR